MEIYLAEIPKANGHEQSGFRPVILISKPISNISIILPLTSNLLALKFPFTIKVEPSILNGLTFISVILVFQIRAIDSKRLKKKIGVLENNYVESIKKLLNNMLGLRQ